MVLRQVQAELCVVLMHYHHHYPEDDSLVDLYKDRVIVFLFSANEQEELKVQHARKICVQAKVNPV